MQPEGLAPFESSIAERYHEETKYSPASLRREAQQGPAMDWARQPTPFKHLDGPRTLLPVDGLPVQRRAGAPVADAPAAAPGRPDLARLARILWHTNGCTRIVRAGSSVHHFRAAPSAGAMYPTEVYVAVRDVPGIAPGIYDYSVLEHALVPVRSADASEALVVAAYQHPAMVAAGAAVILTAEWVRSAWRYRERGYRRALLDTGHVLGNLVEAAPAEGLRAVPLLSFRDDLLETMLGIDPADEGPLALVPLVDERTFAALPALPLHRSATTEWRRALAAVGERVADREPRRLAAALHLASRLGPDAPPVLPPPVLPPVTTPPGPGGDVLSGDLSPGPVPRPRATTWSDDEPVTDTIAARRSTRSFRPGELPREALFRALNHAFAADARELGAPGLLRTFVVAVRVGGVPPGTYAFDPLAGTLAELQQGDHGGALVHLGLGQEIFHHAAAAVIHTADLPRAVERFGDRAYRFLGLDAGHLGERFNLALLHEGYGVSGCGGYFDDEMNRVLGIPESQAVVYITSAGVPDDAAE